MKGKSQTSSCGVHTVFGISISVGIPADASTSVVGTSAVAGL
jgi:hypothetical protein